MNFTAYLPEYNPSNLTGTVGGTISSTQFSGYVNELFYHVSTPPSGAESGFFQYRKLYIKNVSAFNYIGCRVWVDSVEHPEQIKIQLASGLDTTTNPITAPTLSGTWESPSNYAEGISLGTLNINNSTGIWIRQELSGISEEDPYATFRLSCGGYKT